MANQVICLPLYPELEEEKVNEIAKIIDSFAKK